MRPTIHETMMNIAEVISKRSTCSRREVGCVLVDENNRVLSVGHNGVAKGTRHCTDQPCPGAHCPSGTGLDLCEAIHAEQNSLLFCPDIMKIRSAYITASPCVSCVKMLMNTACKEIYFKEEYPHRSARDLWLIDPTRKWIKL